MVVLENILRKCNFYFLLAFLLTRISARLQLVDVDQLAL